MKKYYLFIIFLTLCSYILAQNNKVGVVTNVDCFLTNLSIVSTKSFPFYFHHKEFIEDVHSDISKLIKEKFSLDTVLFLNSKRIKYTEGIFAPSQNGREIAKISGVKGNLYVQIRSMLAEGFIKSGEWGYNFNTKKKQSRR